MPAETVHRSNPKGIVMRTIKQLLLAFALVCGVCAGPALAGDADPL
jgi:hypothetical protein